MKNEIEEKMEQLESDKNLEKTLTSTLLSVGISANLNGYQYLKDCIKLAIANPFCVNSITRIMYPQVARTFNTTACRVERGIRHALEVAYNKGKICELNRIFGLKIFDKNDKPTNSEFVALIADRLSLEFDLVFNNTQK